jgi:uncharacterized protein
VTKANLLSLLLLCSAAACEAPQRQQSALVETGEVDRQADVSNFPALTGRVVDEAAILSAEMEGWASAELARLERRTSDQIVLVTLPNLGGRSIEEVGLALGNSWGIGKRELDNGVLLIIAPNDRKVRIAVGYGLEGLLTDEKAAAIIDKQLLPQLREGNYDKAVKAGVMRIAATLESDLRRPFRKGKGS